MKKLLTFREFINESIGSVIGSPVKFAKIKNNAKKYQKALVQKALNDVEYEKKKAAAKKDPDTQVGVLAAAKKAKDQSLNDVVSSISDRIDKLATTEPLKNVASLAKSKAKIAAAQTSLKAANAEETKQLNLKIKKLSQKAEQDKQELKDYEKASDDSKETSSQKSDKEDKNKSTVNNINKETDTKDDAVQNLNDKIKKVNVSLNNAKRAIDEANIDKKRLSDELKTVKKPSEEENQIVNALSEVNKKILAKERQIEKLNDDLKKLQADLNKLNK